MHDECCCVFSLFLCRTRIDSFVYPQPEKKLESLSLWLYLGGECLLVPYIFVDAMATKTMCSC